MGGLCGGGVVGLFGGLAIGVDGGLNCWLTCWSGVEVPSSSVEVEPVVSTLNRAGEALVGVEGASIRSSGGKKWVGLLIGLTVGTLGGGGDSFTLGDDTFIAGGIFGTYSLSQVAFGSFSAISKNISLNSFNPRNFASPLWFGFCSRVLHKSWAALITISPCVSEGFVMYLCLKNTVSLILSPLVALT